MKLTHRLRHDGTYRLAFACIACLWAAGFSQPVFGIEQVEAQVENTLEIGRPVDIGLTRVDWGVIILYGVGMLLVGWFYSRKNKTSEDYLLAGRKMKPWAAGLSLFAGLVSLLSYLAYPGEMIQHGPMFLSELAAYPLIYGIVGWIIIPFIMKFRVTSAYEILETRFGLGIRLLGSSFFLLMRLMWMAVILHATNMVLGPMMGIPRENQIWIGLVIGTITVIYTSIGGLSAVVVTDVIQSLILFLGAIVTILLVSVKLGGFAAWWPETYQAHWQTPSFGFQTDARMTFGWIFVMAVTWYICTTSSDQIAIQRFLSTRDVRAARRSLWTTLVSVCFVCTLLALVGCALLAFFRENPHLLGEGQSIEKTGDQLFTRFISLEMTGGFAGLLIAALLSAGMSSLSAGISAAGSVITSDFINRFRRTKLEDRQQMRAARYVSWIIGIIAVFSSVLVSVVPGNLYEICNTVVSLLVAPLFILFCMAMWIPWATAFGTWAGAIASTVTAVLIGHWEAIMGSPGPSFVWLLPCSMLAGVVGGMIFSLLPIGPKARAPIRQIVEFDDAPSTTTTTG